MSESCSFPQNIRLGGTRRAAALPLLTLLAACSVDGTGLSAARVSPADGAVVVELYALGAALRLQPGDQGLSLGGSRRTYIFPLAEAPALRPGWHYFLIDLPAVQPVALHGTSYGLDLSAMPQQTALNLGFSDIVVLADAPADAALLMQLSYQPDRPETTRLSYCQRDITPC